MRYELVIMDVSSAFGQSDHRERQKGPLFATMPPSGLPGKSQDYIARVLRAVYGVVHLAKNCSESLGRVGLQGVHL